MHILPIETRNRWDILIHHGLCGTAAASVAGVKKADVLAGIRSGINPIRLALPAIQHGGGLNGHNWLDVNVRQAWHNGQGCRPECQVAKHIRDAIYRDVVYMRFLWRRSGP